MTRQRQLHRFGLVCGVSLGLLCCAPAFGQQKERSGQSSDPNSQQAAGQSANQPEIPQSLDQLDLSSEQESQIKEALQQQNQKLNETWKQFHKQHAQVINLEAAWTSSVRDSLSEEDQRKFDQQRMQDRETARYSAEDASQQRGSAADRRRDARQRRRTDAAESAENRETDRRRQQRDERQQSRSDSQQAGDRSQQDRREQDEYSFVVITSFSPERFIQGTNQTSAQKQQCSEACRAYKEELRSAWQKLHQLHHELVQIEADRIQAVEQQLTEEQLTKLQEQRQKPQQEAASTPSTSQQNR